MGKITVVISPVANTMITTDGDLSGHELKGQDTYLKRKETNIIILAGMGKKLYI
jgi:hypothetical protein